MLKIDNTNISKSSFAFPSSDIDTFYEELPENIKEKLDPNNLSEIDFANRIYYTFYDMEDGNYLAVDKKLTVYSLVHDARPMAKKMKITFGEILNDLANNKFDKEKHCEERCEASG